MAPIVASLLLLLSPIGAQGADLLTKASGKDCVQGLHRQPPGGPFSVFLFCDDAAGSNIGIVNAIPGAGPGKIDLGPRKEWSNWDVNNRFWQDRAWATDVTSFAWSADLKFLYVATGEVYGTGCLYKLDLVARTSAKLVPDAATQGRIPKGATFQTEIQSIDPASGLLQVVLTVNKSEGAAERISLTVK